MIQHDKHQYYFEKYLRNEMSYHERMAFDEKLEEDAELKKDFEFYKSHRMAMLHELIQEHKLARRDNRLNRLIFLLISLTGIALTFNYFIHYRENTQAVISGKAPKERKPFYTYIPFVNWEKRAEKQTAKMDIPVKKDSTVTKEPADAEPIMLEPSSTDDERTATDVFLTDSFITVHDKAYIQGLFAAKRNGPDTSLLDSVTTQPHKIRTKEKAQQLFVEFWQSPVQYKGYKFTGKKLILYGLEAPYEIYVYKENNQVYLIHSYGETALAQHTNFQPF